jgi:cytochrome c oxidase cbb3-type subunit III
MRRSIALLLLLAAAALVVGLYRSHLQSQLLRADPDALAPHASLVEFAVRNGASIFDSHCAQCHGPKGHGSTSLGVPDLTDADWLYGEGSVADIERVINYGIRSNNPKAWNLARMPAFGRPQTNPPNPNIRPLSAGAINDVIEYLRSLQGSSADGHAVARGASVFGNTGGCFDCHGADAKGDAAIGAPNLVDHITLYGDGSRQSLFDSIAIGRQGVCPDWSGKLTPAQIRETAFYVHSLASSARTPQVTQ